MTVRAFVSGPESTATVGTASRAVSAAFRGIALTPRLNGAAHHILFRLKVEKQSSVPCLISIFSCLSHYSL